MILASPGLPLFLPSFNLLLQSFSFSPFFFCCRYLLSYLPLPFLLLSLFVWYISFISDSSILSLILFLFLSWLFPPPFLYVSLFLTFSCRLPSSFLSCLSLSSSPYPVSLPFLILSLFHSLSCLSSSPYPVSLPLPILSSSSPYPVSLPLPILSLFISLACLSSFLYPVSSSLSYPCLSSSPYPVSLHFSILSLFLSSLPLSLFQPDLRSCQSFHGISHTWLIFVWKCILFKPSTLFIARCALFIVTFYFNFKYHYINVPKWLVRYNITPRLLVSIQF